jgi:hypothetical protein
MIESEWFTTENTKAMIDAVADKITARKFRLFMVAWCRRDWDRIQFPIVKEAVQLAERFADGNASKKNLEAMFDRVRRAPIWGWDHVRTVVWPDSRQMAESAEQFCRQVGGWHIEPQPFDPARHELFRQTLRLRNDMLRDIIGNPYRPAFFSPSWRTDTAVTLAQQMYESRDFGAMPILADALQDAGCDNEDILNHCRDMTATHVRGCWVVDLVLGKN